MCYSTSVSVGPFYTIVIALLMLKCKSGISMLFELPLYSWVDLSKKIKCIPLISKFLWLPGKCSGVNTQYILLKHKKLVMWM